MCGEKNARIFEDKARNSNNLWDSIHFLASLWAFCYVVFKGIPLNVLQLDWLTVCTLPKELVRSFHFVASCSFIVVVSFFFGGRILHPSFVLLFSINISIYCFLSKKKKSLPKSPLEYQFLPQ